MANFIMSDVACCDSDSQPSIVANSLPLKIENNDVVWHYVEQIDMILLKLKEF